MSAVENTGHRLANGVPTVCRVVDGRQSPGFRWPNYWTVVDGTGREIDRFRSALAAEYYCVQLNAGVARFNPHAVIGCKVEAMS